MTDRDTARVTPAEAPAASSPASVPQDAAQREAFLLPTSLGQERFWHLDRLEPGNPTWNLPVRFRLQGALNVDFVERAFNDIVRRHEVLRATYAAGDGHPVQIIQSSFRIDVPVIDLRQLPKAERDAEVDRLSLQEARRRFDLATGPLLRVGLLQTEDHEHVLLVTPHHSVADYWSIGIISNELGAAYEAYVRGVDPVLPELPVQYGDYAIWQREQTQSAVVLDELAQWKRRLENLPLLEFPTDRPRPNFPTYNATITSTLLPVKLTDAIRDISNREGATFFNTMLAVLSVVLHHCTGQTDFGVATQVAGRDNVELEPLVGLFINTVVLRMNLAGNPTFSQLLSRVQEVSMDSLANQNVRFEQLLRQIRPNDYPSHHTLFRVNFICQRDPVKPLEFSGIKLTVIPSKSQGALYDLNVFLVLRNEGWRLACEYNTDLFDAGTITQLLDNYKKVLESIAGSPNRRLSEFLVSEGTASSGDQKPAVGTATNPSAESTSPMTSVRTISLQEPAGEAFAMPPSVAQRRFWVLEELAPGNPALHMRACVRVAGALSQSTLEKSFQLLVDRHEILRTTFGKIDGELVQIIAPTRMVSLPVTSIESAVGAGRDARLWQAIRKEASAPFDLTRGPLIRARLFRLGPDEHVLVITTHHILADGWSQNVIQRDLWALYEALSEGHEPSLPALPIQYGDFVHWQQEWLGSNTAREELEYWKKQLAPPLPVLDLPTGRPVHNRMASSGAMETLLLPEDLIRSLKTLSQSQNVTMFALLLTAFGALLNRYTGQEDMVISSPVANRKLETEPLIGPFAGVVALRLNLSGNLTFRELLGRIRDTTLDALSHSELPFEVLADELRVRSVHGRNPLSQVYFFYQSAFLQPRQLRELTVTPLPDFGLGTFFELQLGLLERREGVRAQLEYNPTLFTSSAIQGLLEDYRTVLETLGHNPDGRLGQLSLALRQDSKPTPLASASRIPAARPPNQNEKQMIAIWEDVLGIRPVDLYQDYFELGGTSLLAVRLFAQIEKTFGVALPLSALFGASTVEKLAAALEGGDEKPGWSPLVEIQTGGSRPPFFCIHGGGGNVLIYRDLSRRLGNDQPFYGLQCQGLDGKQPLLTTIEDMAELYAKEIRKAQPHGPYLLGGYCMGGTVALEIAQQLKAQGEEVALLALFDTLNWPKLPPASARNKVRHQVQRIMFHVGNFLSLNFKDRITFLSEKLKVLSSRAVVWRGMILGKFATDRNESQSRLLARIWEINDRAILTYIPRPYPGVITDFRPLKQYADYRAPDVNWDHLAVEGQKIVTLPVYPAGMLLEPFVKELAGALRISIDNAIRTGETE